MLKQLPYVPCLLSLIPNEDVVLLTVSIHVHTYSTWTHHVYKDCCIMFTNFSEVHSIYCIYFLLK